MIKGLLFWLLPRRLIKNHTSRNGFGFLIHLGSIKDLKRKYRLLSPVPDFLLEALIDLFPPLVIADINGKGDLQDIYGHIILCPITARKMLINKSKAVKKIEAALKLCEKMGLKLAGLGAYTASVTGGGAELAGKTSIAVTNGNSYTSLIAIRDIGKIIGQYFNGRDTGMVIAVIGATGSIGSAISKTLCKRGFSKLILVGRNPEKLRALRESLEPGQSGMCDIDLSVRISDIDQADLIIVTTSAIGAVVRPEHLKKNAVIYDLTQPKNVNREVARERPDVVIIDGGLVKTQNIDYSFNFYLPSETIFACLAETIILTAKKVFSDFSIGNVTLQKIDEIEGISKGLSFQSAPFCSFGKEIT